MIVALVIVAVVVLLVALLVAAFLINRQAVATATAAITAELGNQPMEARAAANCTSGGPRGMGILVVTPRALHFRGVRATETLVIPRKGLRAEVRADGKRPVLAVTSPTGEVTWRIAEAEALANALTGGSRAQRRAR